MQTKWCNCNHDENFDLYSINDQHYTDYPYCYSCGNRIHSDAIIRILMKEVDKLKDIILDMKSDNESVKKIVLDEQFERNRMAMEEEEERLKELKIMEKQTERFEMMDL